MRPECSKRSSGVEERRKPNGVLPDYNLYSPHRCLVVPVVAAEHIQPLVGHIVLISRFSNLCKVKIKLYY
ncbi:hypothetical protein Hanom_Chr03g00235051 [Helianthus anomalus]